LAKHRPADGAPDIAHPGEKGKYERQLAFIASWFFEMWERMELDDEKLARPGHEARCELQTLLLNTIGQVLRTALKGRGRPKKWAGELLAIISVSTGKQDKKLRRVNAAYVRMKKKLSGKSLSAALFPKYIGEIMQRELKRAERYRERLMVLKAGCGEGRKPQWLSIPGKPPRLLSHGSKGWEAVARGQRIPQVYWTSVKLPDFSVKSARKWWEFLWPLISKKIKVPKLNSRYQMARKRYVADSGTTAHDHLKLLARLRDKGVLF
jgi:hypothetical protein